MVECGICLEDCQESDLELHRVMCVVRLMFRCSLCGQDYVSKEGLWNHLDLHEIADESKEWNYEEIKAKHKLHQCVLCNDQRAYSERPYWKHVQDVHDGFFLRCSDCGESFRSEKLKNDHASSCCKARDQKGAMNLNNLKEEPDQIDKEHMNSSAENAKQDQKQILVSSLDSPSSSNVAEDPDLSTANKDLVDKNVQPLVEDQSGMSFGIQCMYCGRECPSTRYLHRHIGEVHKPTKCEICGITFKGSSRFRYHKVMSHGKTKYQCGKCQKIFLRLKPYKHHTNICDPIQSDFSIYGKSGDIFLKHKNVSNPVVDNPSSEVCSQCGIKESCAYTLARHTLIHHDPVACDFCGINLPCLLEAQRHVKMKHQESKYKCPHCSMRFGWARRLDRHVFHCKDKKVPCELCGKMLRDEIAVKRHKGKSYCAYQKTKEQPFFDSSLPQTKCHYCSEEFPSMGLLNRHLKVFHELTKCDICGITVLGLSVYKIHKIKWHKESEYKCPTCGKIFHHLSKYKMHSFACEKKKYSCQLCGRMFQQLRSVKEHTKRVHPDEMSFNNIQIVQLEKQGQSNDLKMEITVEETTISAHNHPGQSNGSLSFNVDALSESSSVLETENPSNQLTSVSSARASYHMQTIHKEAKHQCPNCPRKFHCISNVEKHASLCVDFTHSCDLCGLRFALPSLLENHKRQAHGDRSIKCSGVLDEAQLSEVLDTEQLDRKKTGTSDNLEIVAHEGMQRALNKMGSEVDAFQTFGNFIASKLRQIPAVAVANRVKRNLTRNLMDLLDEAEADQML